MRSVVMSVSQTSVPGIPDFPKYPFYMGKYQILDLMKLQFSRIAKDYRRTFAGLMTRPKIEFVESYRFDTNISNREYRRRWYRNHNGRFIASEHKKHLVLTARPGPGPLVKSAMYLKRHNEYVTRRATASERKNLRKERKSIPPRIDAVSTQKYVVPGRRKAVSNGQAPFIGARIIRKGDERMGVRSQYDPEYNRYWIHVPGGLTRPSFQNYFLDPPPRKDWVKYSYFYRKHGRWRPSEHHPYEDEDIAIERWLIEQRVNVVQM